MLRGFKAGSISSCGAVDDGGECDGVGVLLPFGTYALRTRRWRQEFVAALAGRAHRLDLIMITMFGPRLLCGLAVLAPVVLALPPTQAAAHAQLAPVQRDAELRAAAEED